MNSKSRYNKLTKELENEEELNKKYGYHEEDEKEEFDIDQLEYIDEIYNFYNKRFKKNHIIEILNKFDW